MKTSKAMTKTEIIERIKTNLKWPEEVPSEWLMKLRKKELEKLLYYSEHNTVNMVRSRSLTGIMEWKLTNEGFYYWYSINERITK